jgi:UDP-MurNAc hydroxylase
MYFRILSHACLLVSGGGKALLTDPWLLGSCYWRSWWNYPPVEPALWEGLQPDAIYITHVHWDHFHGATLKRFDRGTLVLVPEFPSGRMRRDLRAMGFRNIVEIPHAASQAIGDDMRVTSYQFSPWGDSAVVIETEGVKLLNANDAKFMGAPLGQILRRHGRFDFAFRSHSSANDRVCYEFIDSIEAHREDPSVYAESFRRFMTKVAPRYAVPFASNHCFLHRDVVRFNRIVETPSEVRHHVDSTGGLPGTELRIMVSGDAWDSRAGFSMSAEDWFADREARIRAYADANEARLEATYRIEDRVRVRFDEFERFFRDFLAAVPRLLKRPLRGHPIVFAARHGGGVDHFLVDVWAGRVEALEPHQLPAEPILFEAPAVVLRKAMAANMFSHIGISKRVTYRSRREDARHITHLNQLLAAYEYEVLPLSGFLTLRTLRVYLRRWREVILYAQLFVGLRRGRTTHQLEAEHLA